MDDDRQPTAPFLTGSRLGLRHPVLADARNATSWHEGPFPLSETQAGELLRSTEIHPWGAAPETRLIADSVPDGATLGGAVSATEFAGNARSAAALRKQGYRLASRLSADAHRRGQFMDTVVFDLLRVDWEAARPPRSSGSGGGPPS